MGDKRESSAGEGSTSPQPDVKTMSTTPSPTPERQETPGVIARDRVLQTNLKIMNKSLLKPSHAKLPTLKTNNYHNWAQAHKRFLAGREMYGFVTKNLLYPLNDSEVKSTN